MLSYKEVKRLDGTRVKAVKWVNWEDAPISLISIPFKTIGTRELPARVSVPYGYRMIDHPKWLETVRDIKKDVKTATFEQLALMEFDLEVLAAETQLSASIDPGYSVSEDRPEYGDFIYDNEESWVALRDAVLNAFDRACPHMPPHVDHQDHVLYSEISGLPPVPNQCPAPTLRAALEKMLASLD